MKKRIIELTNVVEITSKSATFELFFENHQKTDVSIIGVCCGLEPNPVFDHNHDNMYDLSCYFGFSDELEGAETFLIENLFADTEYYVRAFIYEEDNDHNDENNYVYSNQIKIRTEDLPLHPCDLLPNIVNVSGVAKEMHPGVLNRDESSLSVTYNTVSDLGDFWLEFSKEPMSGIYKTGFDYSHKTYFSTRIHCYIPIPGGYNCRYKSLPNQEVYVKNDGVGNVIISFCDMEFESDYPCEEIRILSGQLKNY